MVLNHVVLLVKMDQIYKVVYFHKHCSNTQKHDAQLYKQTNLLWKKSQQIQRTALILWLQNLLFYTTQSVFPLYKPPSSFIQKYFLAPQLWHLYS